MFQNSPLRCMWYQLIQRAFQLVMVLKYHVRYSGWHNIPKEGGVLVVSNHQSHLDPPLVGIGCRRPMSYLARESLFRFAPFGRFIYSIGAIPLDRDGVGLSGIKEALKRLKRGEMVVVFPEGTRSKDGKIAPFRPGFTTLAVRSKAAILPVAIDGAFEAYPRWRKFPGPGRIRVHYGVPLTAAELEGRDERELVNEIEDRVRKCQDLLRGFSH